MRTVNNAAGGLQRAAYRVWIAAGTLVLLWFAWRMLARPLAVVIPPLLLATVVVYLLAPAVASLERRGLPRWLGTLLSYAAALLVLAVATAVLVPLLAEQVRAFAADLPDFTGQLVDDLNARLAGLGLAAPDGSTFDVAALSANIEQALEGGTGAAAVAGVLGGLSGLASGFLQVALVFVLGPVIAFYVLVDLPRLGRLLRRLLPPEYRAEAAAIGLALHEVVGGFIRGQLLVAAFVGIATSAGLAIIGLPFWLLVGATAGVTNLIPLLGPLVAGALGVSIALVSRGPTLALLVVVVMVVVQQLDNQAISPLVMGRNVRLHPLAVLLALVVAGTLYGFFGLLIAVPFVAAANVLARHLWRTRVPWADAPDADDGADGDDDGPADGDAAALASSTAT